MNRNRLFKVLSVLTVVATTYALPAIGVTHAAPAAHSTSGVYALVSGLTVDPSNAMGTSTLARDASGISMTLHTSGLPPNSADTVWWVVFNYPQYCTHPTTGSRCGLGDLFSNSAVQASVLYAAGHVVGGDGVGDFGAHLSTGDTSGCVPAAVPPHFPCNAGLVNVGGADVDLVVRTHGNPIPGMVDDQIQSFAGGCQINLCKNLQESSQQGND